MVGNLARRSRTAFGRVDVLEGSKSDSDAKVRRDAIAVVLKELVAGKAARNVVTEKACMMRVDDYCLVAIQIEPTSSIKITFR